MATEFLIVILNSALLALYLNIIVFYFYLLKLYSCKNGYKLNDDIHDKGAVESWLLVAFIKVLPLN